MSRPSEAIRAALKGHDPSPEQWAAISHPPEPLAVIAGAGSGKTAVMAARMVLLVEEGLVRPVQILGLTFTNKAAEELEARILRAFSALGASGQDLPLIATYNTFADRLVREHGVRIGIDPEVGLLSAAQSWQLMSEALGQVDPFDAIDSRSASSICQKGIALADACANNLVDPSRIEEEEKRALGAGDVFSRELAETARKRIELARLVAAYQHVKARANRIDFGDQVARAVEILEQHPEVVSAMRERHQAILLDEYQDTNVAQRRMLQALVPPGGNVTAVGDARQNIYQWRGSSLFNLIDFPRRHFLREGGAHDYTSLSTSYRCGARILRAANHLIGSVAAERRPGLALEADPSNGEGFVGTRLAGDEHREASYIAGEISTIHGVPASAGRDRLAWRDIAILVRRKSQMTAILEALSAKEIPVEVVGLGGLLQLPEVMDVVAWLRVVADPGPSSNRWLARILMGPRFRVHYRDLALLARWAGEHTRSLADAKRGGEGAGGAVVEDATAYEPDEVAFSLGEALDHLGEIALPPEAMRRLSQAAGELASLRAQASRPLLEFVQAVVDQAGLSEELEASPRADSAVALANLRRFVGWVGSFAPVSGEASVAELVSYLDAAEETDETLELDAPALEDSVKLMTVHQAKGLEFEVVFIPGVAAGINAAGERVYSIFPDQRTTDPTRAFDQLPNFVRDDAEHLPSPWKQTGEGAQVPKKKVEYMRELKERAVEDERRLFYVGMTRAKQRLYITAAYWYGTTASARGPSLFFDEVAAVEGVSDLGRDDQPADNPLMEAFEAKAVWPPQPAHRSAGAAGGNYPALVEDLIAGRLAAGALIGELAEPERELAAALLDEHRKTLQALARRDGGGGSTGPRLPASIKATDAASLATGKLEAAKLLRPLPEKPSAAARIGTEVHRWIEERSRGLAPIDDEVLDLPVAWVEPSQMQRLRQSFKESEYSGRPLAVLDTGEPASEVSFVLKLGSRLVRGKIDAVYESGDGGLEIVDYKTGREFAAGELDQLDVYAVALSEILPDRVRDHPLTLTYLFLGSDESARKVSRTLEPGSAAGLLARIQAAVERAGTAPAASS